MEKIIKKISELSLGKEVASGSCSSIYQFGDGMYFKKFNDDYRDLSDFINREFFETIRYLSDISGMPFIVRGKDIYRSEDELFGYSMPVVCAEELHSIDDGILIDDLLNSIGTLSNDIRILADNRVKTEDIGGDNILYNGNMYLIDLDLSLIDKRYVPDELYERCLHSVLCAVRGRVLGDERYRDKLKDGDYLTYFKRLREICSEGIGEDIQTIGQFKDSYQKVKTKCFL